MKAGDTVMGLGELWDIEEAVEDAVFSGQATDTKPLAVAKAQAEISFTAGEDKGYAHARQHCEDVIIPQAKAEGIKEVVDEIGVFVDRWRIKKPEEVLRAIEVKLKEWGIK